MAGSVSPSLFREAKARRVQSRQCPSEEASPLTLAPLKEKVGVPGRYGGPLANSLSVPALAPQVWLAPALSVKHASRACCQTCGSGEYFFSSTGSDPRPDNPLQQLCQLLPAAAPSHRGAKLQVSSYAPPHKISSLLYRVSLPGFPTPTLTHRGL